MLRIIVLLSLLLLSVVIGCYPPSYYDRWNTHSVELYPESYDYYYPYTYSNYYPYYYLYSYPYFPFSFSLNYSYYTYRHDYPYQRHYRGREPYQRHYPERHSYRDFNHGSRDKKETRGRK